MKPSVLSMFWSFAKSRPERRSEPLPGDVLLTLFCWSSVVLLCSLGSLDKLRLDELSVFAAWGTLLLTCAACAALAAMYSGRNLVLIVFISYTGLVVLPAAVLELEASPLMLLFDLYFLSLVATPAFLNLWSWHYQAVGGLTALLAVSMLWLPVGSWEALHSVTLLAIGVVISGCVSLLRSRESVEEAEALERKVLRLWSDSARETLPQYVWNVLLLEVGLLILLFFLDVMLWREDVFGLLAIKGYGFVLLVFGGLLMKLARKEFLEYLCALTTASFAVILSVARLGYTDAGYLSTALPLVYLILILCVLPIRLELQVISVWFICLMDLAVKFLGTTSSAGFSWDAVGAVLTHYRGEIFVLSLGATVALVAGRTVRRSRMYNFSQFSEVDAPSERKTGPASEAATMSVRAADGVEPERRRLLVAGIVVLGVLSCIASSRLAVEITGRSELAIFSWLGFFVLWTIIVFAERRKGDGDYFWMVAALTEVVLVLWPSVLLLFSANPGNQWLLWPALILLGIGAVPWAAKELIPLLLIGCFAGVEIVYRLNLGLWAIGIYTAAVFLAVLCSLQGAQRLKEKALLLRFPSWLAASGSEHEVMRILADSILCLFNASSVLYSLRSGELHLVRNGASFELRPDAWPLRKLAAQLFNARRDGGRPYLQRASWLPTTWSFIDRRFGLFSATHGLLLELGLGERKPENGTANGSAQHEIDDEAVLLFIPFHFPLFEFLRAGELRTAEALSAASRLKLEALLRDQALVRVEKLSEQRLQEREYELNALVHDINNTVQDLTLLCDTVLEDYLKPASRNDADGLPPDSQDLDGQVRRVANLARSVATVVSDAKRRRELERLSDLRPRELVEVTRVVREITSFAVIRAERKRVGVHLHQLPEQEVWVRVSVREHLEAILRNLLNNAVAYSRPGSTVSIGLRVSPEWVTIDVTDTGSGFLPEEAEAIFKSGFRGKSSAGVSGGLGLGLAESRRIAEAAGGRLSARSEGEGKGATFTVELPCASAPRPVDAANPWALIVDDQPAIAEMYARLVRALGLTPVTAHAVAEALETAADKGRPSVVITDVHLGAVSGLELVKRLRADYGQALPILVISGLTDADVAEQARIAGATDFVAKPIGRQALFARIQSLLPPMISA